MTTDNTNNIMSAQASTAPQTFRMVDSRTPVNAKKRGSGGCGCGGCGCGGKGKKTQEPAPDKHD